MQFPSVVVAKVSQRIGRIEAILAEEILRFQCVEGEETEGEAGIHARESDAAKTCATSEGLALEQLGILRKWRLRVGEDGSDGLRGGG